jgi:hypothetical protein
LTFSFASKPFARISPQMATDAATAAATDPTTGEVKRSAALMQAYRLREVAFRFALDVAGVTVKDPSPELCSRARDFAACVKAWSDTNSQARIANGTPLPGSLRPERKTKPKRSPRIAPIIPREDEPSLQASETTTPTTAPVQPTSTTDQPK